MKISAHMRSTPPILSIVIPVYNMEPYIAATLDSIATITSKVACEVIIQNACSTDKTGQIIDRYCRKHPGWIHCNENDGGQSDGINRGMKKAHGVWVTWLCGDDLLLPDFAVMMGQKDNDQYDVIYGDVVFWDEKNSFPAIGTETYHSGILSSKRLMIQQPGTCIRRQLWNRLRGVRTEMYFHMDYDLFLRLEANNARFKRYPLFIAQATLRPDAKTSSPSFRRLSEYFDIFSHAHMRKPQYFSVRPYAVYSVEYILKNLEAKMRNRTHSIYHTLHQKLTPFFWALAQPVEAEEIERRYRAQYP